nr:hypothetical protein CFP56_55918 [Quercus suber]
MGLSSLFYIPSRRFAIRCSQSHRFAVLSLKVSSIHHTDEDEIIIKLLTGSTSQRKEIVQAQKLIGPQRLLIERVANSFGWIIILPPCWLPQSHRLVGRASGCNGLILGN